MKTFTCNEVRFLEIIATNSRGSNPEMAEFLSRSILTRLANEARLAGLILLKREREAAELAKSFSKEIVEEVRNFCRWIETKVRDAIAELEEHIVNSRRHLLRMELS